MHEHIEDLSRQVRRLKTQVKEAEARNAAVHAQIEENVNRTEERVRALLVQHEKDLSRQKEIRKAKEKAKRHKLAEEWRQEVRRVNESLTQSLDEANESLAIESEHSDMQWDKLLEFRDCVFGISHRDSPVDNHHHQLLATLFGALVRMGTGRMDVPFQSKAKGSNVILKKWPVAVRSTNEGESFHASLMLAPSTRTQVRHSHPPLVTRILSRALMSAIEPIPIQIRDPQPLIPRMIQSGLSMWTRGISGEYVLYVASGMEPMESLHTADNLFFQWLASHFSHQPMRGNAVITSHHHLPSLLAPTIVTTRMYRHLITSGFFTQSFTNGRVMFGRIVFIIGDTSGVNNPGWHVRLNGNN